MPKYYCDYCDTYLTHDSPSVRKTHCAGRKHKDNVKFFYQKWMEDQAQSLIDATTAAFKAGKIPANPFGMGKGVNIPPPSMMGPGGMRMPMGMNIPPPGMGPPGGPLLGPPGRPPMLPQGMPPGMMMPPGGLPPPGMPPGMLAGLRPPMGMGMPPLMHSQMPGLMPRPLMSQPPTSQ